MEAFWTFFIVVGGSGATMGLVICYLRSKSAHLRSIGRLSIVPTCFNINEPVIFGTPIVMNPVFFIPFLLAPMVNAVLAWGAMKMDLIGRVISVVPWTAPAPIGAAWALGWDFRAAILVVLLAVVSAIIYFPFFKVYEKQLLEQEAEEAQKTADEESQQAA
jgi:PTS system cellobiose-specific IIC component